MKMTFKQQKAFLKAVDREKVKAGKLKSDIEKETDAVQNYFRHYEILNTGLDKKKEKEIIDFFRTPCGYIGREYGIPRTEKMRFAFLPMQDTEGDLTTGYTGRLVVGKTSDGAIIHHFEMDCRFALESSRFEMIAMFGHEMTHLMDNLNGDLVGYNNETIYWKGEPYSVEDVEAANDRLDGSYHDYEWERRSNINSCIVTRNYYEKVGRKMSLYEVQRLAGKVAYAFWPMEMEAHYKIHGSYDTYPNAVQREQIADFVLIGQLPPEFEKYAYYHKGE